MKQLVLTPEEQQASRGSQLCETLCYIEVLLTERVLSFAEKDIVLVSV
jgi:hypothetical protein